MNPALRNMAINAFLRTYDADPPAGRPLLERLLDPERLKSTGPLEFNAIGYQLKYVEDPEALELAYRVVFTDIEQPAGPVEMGAPSALFGFSQDARQPLRTARWALAEQFPTVLDASPLLAVRALRFALDQANRNKRRGSHTFEIGETQCAFSFDFDESGQATYAPDDWQRMLKAFETRLARSLEVGDRRYIDAITSEAAKDAIPTTFLRMLLRNAEHDPQLALDLLSVVTSLNALRGYDLATSIADYLSTALKTLDHDSRATVESALLDLAATKGDERTRHADQRRLETYLASIPNGVLDTPKLIDLRKTATESELSEQDRSLRLRGTWLGATTMRNLRLSDGAESDGATSPVVALVDEAEELMPHQRPSPEPERLLPLARELQALLLETEGEIRQRLLDVAAALLEYALRHRHATVEDVTDLGSFVIAAADGLHPQQPSAEDDDDERLSWGWPNARILAAQLLGQLYAATEGEQYLTALRRLANDAAPTVRCHAVEAAPYVIGVDAEAAWEIIERASSDASMSVVRTAVVTAARVSGLDPDRYRRLELSVFDRLVAERPATKLATDLQRNLLWRVLTGHDDAIERLEDLLAAPWTSPERGLRIALDLVQVVRHADASMRSAARDRLVRLLTNVIENLRLSAIERGLPESATYLIREGTDGSQQTRIACARILIEVAERLYFDSGAYEADEGRATTQHAPTSEFTAGHFDLVEPILRLLAPVPYTQVSYNVLRILQPAVGFDAEKVLEIASQALRAGISDNLTNEHLGQQQAASLVREYVERHQALLTADRGALKVVMDTVDAFADAGWPDWIDLAFTIDSIYRD